MRFVILTGALFIKDGLIWLSGREYVTPADLTKIVVWIAIVAAIMDIVEWAVGLSRKLKT